MTLSVSNIVDANAVCFLEHAPKASALGHQVTSHEGTNILALGHLCPGFEWNLRTGFKEDLEASCAKGLLVYEASVVY
jgi:hypothetical protein